MKKDNRELALKFVLNTYRNLFITGKAGTGKTTLLKEILSKTTKNTAVVAPTGVAAINAKGMTIHSFLQLPTTSFIPTYDQTGSDQILNKHDLTAQQRIRKERRQVLSQLELLIIDEISMVRADLLDAIDHTLKSIRKSNELFGGVQVVVFGDLHQLSPVVKQHIWPILSRYYKSPFFFSAWSWQHCDAIKIELTKVFRQEDEKFIEILNNIRDGTITDQNIKTLNNRFNSEVNRSNVITLTTHNRKADLINASALEKLPAKEIQLNAKVSGIFNPTAFPTEEKILIKVGAQVMFLRNNPEMNYYNGKIGTVTGMVEDELFIKCDGDDLPIRLTPTDWNNTAYKLSESEDKIVQENIGTFTQYPIKLAWAVTVHKSQGLTFEKVILDLEDTFAPGQLYVALSRCTSLEGITLTSIIEKKNVIVDHRITSFHQENPLPNGIENILIKDQSKAEHIKIVRSFTFQELIDQIGDWKQLLTASIIPEKAKVLKLIKQVLVDITELEKVNMAFQSQLNSLFNSPDEVDHSLIKERLTKAIEYLSEYLYQKVVCKIEEHKKAYIVKKNTKKYIKEMMPVLDLAWQSLNQIYQIKYQNTSFIPEQKYERIKLFDPDNYNQKSKQKTTSHHITYNLYERGYSLEDIANERAMSIGTIETHVARLVKEGKIDVKEMMPNHLYQKIVKLMSEQPENTLTDYKQALPDEITYGQLRMVQSSLDKEK